jgi:DNA ligase-1
VSEYRILKAVEYDKLSASTRKEYPSLKSMVAAGWAYQPKYDGVFGMVRVPEDGEEWRIETRTGQPILSCEHILEGIKGLCLSPGTLLLGELWVPNTPQAKISGMVRSYDLQTDLDFVLFDMVLDPTDPYWFRYSQLQSLCPQLGLGGPGDSLFHTISFRSEHVDPEEESRYWAEEIGYDGIILRDPEAPYTTGLAKAGQIVKVKPTLTIDLAVVGVEEGKGKHAGKMGALLLKLGDKVQRVGTGFSDAERDYWFNAPLDPSPIVEIEYMGMTEAGLLREPRFKGQRFDKERPDA